MHNTLKSNKFHRHEHANYLTISTNKADTVTRVNSGFTERAKIRSKSNAIIILR